MVCKIQQNAQINIQIRLNFKRKFFIKTAQIQEWIKRGEDPKEFLLKECQPQCKFWKDKLGRCEAKLKELVNADPEMSCMYPHRDWVTCVESCVQPAIIRNLYGSKYL